MYSLIYLIVLVVLVGVLLNFFPAIDARLRNLIVILTGLVAVFWLLAAFGFIPGHPVLLR